MKLNCDRRVSRTRDSADARGPAPVGNLGDISLFLPVAAPAGPCFDPPPRSCLVALAAGVMMASLASFATDVPADDEKAQAAELAKKLANPVASLISVPFQNNWDFGYGPENAMRYTVNVQPVIPFSLGEDWNLVTRTIVPVIYAESTAQAVDDKFGLGDIVQSLWLSPKDPTSGGWIWGAGPVLLYPTATDDALGAEKFGLGPTALVLKQAKGWTYGMLANHLWSVAGESSRADVNATFVQPFLSFTTKTSTTFTLNTESTYDWSNHQWTVPLNLMVSQLVKVGKLPIQFAVGPRVYADKPDGGPDWGLRFAVTLLFPK